MRTILKRVFRGLGYEIRRYDPRLPTGEALTRSFAAHAVDAVFDVGANVGNYACSLRRNGFKGRIVSFEPRKGAHEVLVQRARDDRAWVVASPMALGSAPGETEINVSANLASSSLRKMTSLHEQVAPDSKYVAKEKIRVERLDSIFDDYIGEAARPFLKIDTQGYELEVLEGAKECLRRFVGVQAELSMRELYEGQTLWLDFARALEREGFRLSSLCPVLCDGTSGELLQADGVFFRRP